MRAAFLLRSLAAAAAVAMLALLAVPQTASALTPQEMLADKTLEKRARGISAELRCLVCQNQSIDDSDAPLAHDLRVLVRERLKAGDTDEEVRDFLVARYGAFVLLRPPFSPATLLLWFIPLIALAGAGLILWNAFGAPARARATATAASAGRALTEEEQRALDALLADTTPRDRKS